MQRCVCPPAEMQRFCNEALTKGKESPKHASPKHASSTNGKKKSPTAAAAAAAAGVKAIAALRMKLLDVASVKTGQRCRQTTHMLPHTSTTRAAATAVLKSAVAPNKNHRPPKSTFNLTSLPPLAPSPLP